MNARIRPDPGRMSPRCVGIVALAMLASCVALVWLAWALSGPVAPESLP